MTSNLPPDWTAAAAEPREHDRRCKTNCTYRIEADGTCAWGHRSHDCDCEAIAADPDPMGLWS